MYHKTKPNQTNQFNINKQFYLIPHQVYPHLVKVDLRVMGMERYFILPKASGMEPHYQMQFGVIFRTLVGV